MPASIRVRRSGPRYTLEMIPAESAIIMSPASSSASEAVQLHVALPALARRHAHGRLNRVEVVARREDQVL